MSASGTAQPRAWDALARAAATRQRDDSEAELPRELLSFVLADSMYAVPIERVREIVRLRRITPVPRTPAAVLGVIALRGEIVQVVDLRRRLNVPRADETRRSRIIVLHGDELRVTGVLVDAVREVIRVSEDDVRPASSEHDAVCELCIRGDVFVSVIDLDRALELDADA